MKKNKKSTGQGMKKKKQKATGSLSMISIATRDKKLLNYLSEIKDLKRLSVRGYGLINKIPKTTVYNMIYRLQDKGLIYKKHTGNFHITKLGITALEVSSGGVQTLRRGCPDKKINLSTHYLKFKLKGIDRSKFNQERIKDLNPVRTKKVDIKNLPITYIYFEDATIIIKPKEVLISIHDLITKDIDESYFKTFEKAMKYADMLEKVGIFADSMELQHSHYARIESIFADVLYKKFGKYYTETSDGRKFWIDSSPPNRIEDETTDPILREKLDHLISDVGRSEARFSDIDKIIEGLSMVEYVERVRMKRDLIRSKKALPQIDKIDRGYFG